MVERGDYQDLAHAVIVNAVERLIDPDEQYNKAKLRKNGTRQDAYEFLTGQTEMSIFWFETAGRKPLPKDTSLEELAKNLSKIHGELKGSWRNRRGQNNERCDP